MKPATVTLLLLVGFALAHGSSYYDLGGRTLCIDGEAIRVDIDDDRLPHTESHTADIEAALGSELPAILERYSLPYRTRSHCRNLAIRVALLLRRSEDSRGAPFHWLEAAVQVGRGQQDESDLGDLRFDALFTDARFPPAGEEIFATLPSHATELIEDLALAWWDDLERRPGTPSWLPYLGGALALATAATALLLARSYRRRADRAPADPVE